MLKKQLFWIKNLTAEMSTKIGFSTASSRSIERYFFTIDYFGGGCGAVNSK